MPEIFPSKQLWSPEPIEALAIHCSDGRWGLAFDEFCQQELRLTRCDRFVVPGGPAWLTLRDISLMRLYDVAREQIEFLVQAHELDRILLITHFGCAFYTHLLGESPENCLAAQEEDLQSAAGTLRGWFAGVKVEAFVAERDHADRIRFRKVDC